PRRPGPGAGVAHCAQHHRRSFRVPAQASGGAQGQQQSAAWAWRRAGPHRQPDLDVAAGGPVLLLDGRMSLRNLTVLGATGSIGVNTLDVIARHPERYRVIALSGHSRLDLLAAQCAAHKPRYAVVGTAEAAQSPREKLNGEAGEVLYGAEALAQIAALPEVDTVMAAIVGAAGLHPTLAAVRAGKRVLLANKEALVMAGEFFMHEVEASGAVLLPVDSEHNAIYQSLPAGYDGN